jgi:hypothetical protein
MLWQMEKTFIKKLAPFIFKCVGMYGVLSFPETVSSFENIRVTAQVLLICLRKQSFHFSRATFLSDGV